MTKERSPLSKRQYILAIDTTAADAGIGLANGKAVKIKTWISQRNQSKELLPNIDRLLKVTKIKPAQLKWVAVNLGPGSFTGLRIGLSIANAFGYVLKIPVVGDTNLTGNATERISQLFELKSKTTKFKPALPMYGREPRITQAKPKRYL
jgi:tRNA threonylcarbamoyl adenosine modification protein YeaZ